MNKWLIVAFGAIAIALVYVLTSKPSTVVTQSSVGLPAGTGTAINPLSPTAVNSQAPASIAQALSASLSSLGGLFSSASSSLPSSFFQIAAPTQSFNPAAGQSVDLSGLNDAVSAGGGGNVGVDLSSFDFLGEPSAPSFDASSTQDFVSSLNDPSYVTGEYS